MWVLLLHRCRSCSLGSWPGLQRPILHGLWGQHSRHGRKGWWLVLPAIRGAREALGDCTASCPHFFCLPILIFQGRVEFVIDSLGTRITIPFRRHSRLAGLDSGWGTKVVPKSFELSLGPQIQAADVGAAWARPHRRPLWPLFGWVFAVSYLKPPSNMCYDNRNVSFLLSSDGDWHVSEMWAGCLGMSPHAWVVVVGTEGRGAKATV